MIENLEEKLSGKIPIDRDELIKLIDSWGRMYRDGKIIKPIGECHPLDKLDVSQITSMFSVFSNSLFNGNISNWNVSNVENMTSMFTNSKFNGDISNWDVSNVEDTQYMFYNSQFNGDISNWDFNNVEAGYRTFFNSEFDKTFNNKIPINTDELKKWFNDNKELIKDKFINYDELDDYFDSFDR